MIINQLKGTVNQVIPLVGDPDRSIVTLVTDGGESLEAELSTTTAIALGVRPGVTVDLRVVVADVVADPWPLTVPFPEPDGTQLRIDTPYIDAFSNRWTVSVTATHDPRDLVLFVRTHRFSCAATPITQASYEQRFAQVRGQTPRAVEPGRAAPSIVIQPVLTELVDPHYSGYLRLFMRLDYTQLTPAAAQQPPAVSATMAMLVGNTFAAANVSMVVQPSFATIVNNGDGVLVFDYTVSGGAIEVVANANSSGLLTGSSKKTLNCPVGATTAAVYRGIATRSYVLNGELDQRWA